MFPVVLAGVVVCCYIHSCPEEALWKTHPVVVFSDVSSASTPLARATKAKQQKCKQNPPKTKINNKI